MHGNPHKLTDARVGLNGEAVRTALWLGLPSAREYFDPATLSSTDQARIADRRGDRRRADFEVSRALLAFADVGSAAHSLSHSAEHAALLLTPTDWSVGVDLEVARPRDVLRLARFAFDEREVQALEAAPEAARLQLFYTLWTLKESFAKALRLELVAALRRCVFWNEGAEWHGRVPTGAAWSAAVFQPRSEIFVAAACIGETTLMPLQLWEWPPQRRADWPLIAAVCAAAPSSADAAPA
ncbi:4'-phosphopantetheinyl transferase family protein [Steroidobacter sp.]|uniref:4'-phosphopantetheinyl transferase family protein n=1 Tax=Steroidobacter sp. TaxID=1978227 RepID=UPI001A587292|nr:4'-phosphopantetheinyl transferase superfamily protein [Steroidobacter sp.]MBL8267640.1 4'-phosphopantetheinyl transferase superfamily protein [Steroidobacter sp.]